MDVFPRLRDTLTRGFLIEKRLLTPSPDKSAGQAPTPAPNQVGAEPHPAWIAHAKVAKDAKFRHRSGQLRGRTEGLVRYGESGLLAVIKPIASLVANIADR